MDEERQNYLNQLRERLESIAGYQSAALAQGKGLGDINFEQCEPLLQETIDLANEARSLPLELLPLQTLKQLTPPTENLGNTLKSISEFTLVGQDKPENQRNNLQNHVRTEYDALLLAFMPHLAYLTLKHAQVQEVITQSRELLEETQKKTRDILDDLDKRKGEAESIVRATQDAAAKIGVAQFAVRFGEIAKEHVAVAKRWLIAAIVLGLVTIVVAVGFLSWLPVDGELSNPATIQRIVTKIIVISLVYFSAIWASRNYRTHRHLNVVNSHRQNALTTFQTFVKAAGDEDKETKNAVLLEATRCIFSPIATGYLGGDQETPNSSIVEVLTRTVGGVGGK